MKTKLIPFLFIITFTLISTSVFPQETNTKNQGIKQPSSSKENTKATVSKVPEKAASSLPKKIFIACDMEGCACVSNKKIWDVGSPECIQAQRQLTREANAAIQGAFDGGATEVIVADTHNGGPGNFVLEELDPRARYIFGESQSTRLPTIETGQYAGIMFVGYHANEGTYGATMDAGFVYSINGIRIGELGFDAGVAGLYNVPALLVTGDDKFCKEALDLLGNVETAEVKQGIDEFHIISLSPVAACELIRKKACDAMKKIGQIKPLNWGSPIKVIKKFDFRDANKAIWKIPTAKRLDENTIEYEFENIATLWSSMKAGLLSGN